MQMQQYRLKTLSILLLLGFTTHAAYAQNNHKTEVHLPGSIVSDTWLLNNKNQVQIVDVRDNMDSLTNDPKITLKNGTRTILKVGGYIENSKSVNFWALRNKENVHGKILDYMLPTAQEFQEVMQASQINDEKPIIIVPTGDDSTSLQEAAFFAYELEYFGEPSNKVAILNGGVHDWLTFGLPTDNDAIAPMTSGNWSIKPIQSNLRASIKNVLQAKKNYDLLIDARPQQQFEGIEKSATVTNFGTIQNSHSLKPSTLYYQDQYGGWNFYNLAHYNQIFSNYAFQHQSVTSPSIIFCNTGQYAAGAWFALSQIDQNKDVRVFPGGLHEWTSLNYQLVR